MIHQVQRTLPLSMLDHKPSHHLLLSINCKTLICADKLVNAMSCLARINPTCCVTSLKYLPFIHTFVSAVLMTCLNTTTSILLVIFHPKLAFTVCVIHQYKRKENTQGMKLYIPYHNCKFPAIRYCHVLGLLNPSTCRIHTPK